jgi:hypothetical protein
MPVHVYCVWLFLPSRWRHNTEGGAILEASGPKIGQYLRRAGITSKALRNDRHEERWRAARTVLCVVAKYRLQPPWVEARGLT